ncbi:uncharacterized protein RAG0_15230 [Rhynchosporium agropyri]|uniref:2EXR domain-containing protein n=1 Tax=Rhynchosporium agropyri TaxID=914238 RepID=A0A1E1LKA0_9HELO|nr:uncharacterized protein RAG0_15230 [Rhynchosporium agropyri]
MSPSTIFQYFQCFYKNLLTSFEDVEVVPQHSRTKLDGQNAKIFNRFKDLPFEIRVQIWREALDQNGRLIELERTDQGNPVWGWNRNTCEFWRVSPRCRALPAVMQACAEALNEGKRYLEYRCFDSDNKRLPSDGPFEIYFNPRVDIIFFERERPQVHIPRVAFLCTPSMLYCCGHMRMSPLYGIDGGVNLIEALHGFSEDVTQHNFRYGGCTGLKEVHFIVKSKLWPEATASIDQGVGLRPATARGYTMEESLGNEPDMVPSKAEWRMKDKLESRIARVISDQSLPRVGEFRWTGEKMPSFHFSSLCPAPRFGEVYDGLNVDNWDFWNLFGINDDFMENHKARFGCTYLELVISTFGCEVLVPPNVNHGSRMREIGFCGSHADVDEAKDWFKDMLEPKLMSLASRILSQILGIQPDRRTAGVQPSRLNRLANL